MHDLQTIVTNVCSVCLSVCLSRGVLRCSLCQITLASCYNYQLPWTSATWQQFTLIVGYCWRLFVYCVPYTTYGLWRNVQHDPRDCQSTSQLNFLQSPWHSCQPATSAANFQSALLVASVCLNKLSSALRDQSLDRNSFNSFFEPHFFCCQVFNQNFIIYT